MKTTFDEEDIDAKRIKARVSSHEKNERGEGIRLSMTNDVYPRWMSLTIASKYASICSKTLIRYIHEGEIYGTLKKGKWFVDKESLDSFFEQDKIRLIQTKRIGMKR